MSKLEIVNYDEYDAHFEIVGGEIFLHCNVRKCSKSIFKQMVDEWLELSDALRDQGVERVYAVPEAKGFVEYTGWEPVATVEEDGKIKEIYLWETR